MVSVVIVCHHEFGLLQECLSAIALSTVQPKECIIVFNGGNNVDICNQSLPVPCKFLHASKELTVTQARNWGATHAQYDILLFLDPDVLIGKNTLEQMCSHIFDGKYDAVVGSYRLPSKNSSLPTLFKTTMNHFFHQRGKDNTTFWSACGAVSKEVFSLVGSFDESFVKSSIEDIDLGYRIVASGKSIKFDKRIMVTHCKRWHFSQLVRSDIFDRAVPWTKLMLRQKLLRSDLNLAFRFKLSLLFIWISILLLGVNLQYAFILLLGGLLLNIDLLNMFARNFSIARLPGIIGMLIIYYLSAGIGFFLGVASFCFGPLIRPFLRRRVNC